MDCPTCKCKMPGYGPSKCFRCEGVPTLKCSKCEAYLPSQTGYFSRIEKSKPSPVCATCINRPKQRGRRSYDDDDFIGYSGNYTGHGEYDTPSGDYDDNYCD